MVNVFRDAIELLDEHGWRQNGRIGEDGAMCVVGAISEVMHESAWCLDYLHPILDIPNRIAEAQFPDVKAADSIYPSLVVVNDNPGTTKADIVMILEKSAVALEEQI